MDFAEFYKFVGATLGIFATLFTLWDRMLRYRPSVSITAEHTKNGNSRALLRVKNQAPFDILIEQINSTSPHYYVSADSMLGVVHGVLGSAMPVLLTPNEERLLRIGEVTIDGSTAKGSGEHVRFEVCWTRGDHPFLRPFSVRLWTSPADIERRKQAASIRADEMSED